MNGLKTYWGKWFQGRAAICPLPEAAIADCSASGPVDDAVAYWVDRLQLEAPAWLLREHLKEYGAWDRADLCNHRANLERLLWTWASDCAENDDPNYLPYLGC